MPFKQVQFSFNATYSVSEYFMGEMFNPPLLIKIYKAMQS